MKWLLTFLAGVVLGAGGLFIYLRQIPHDAPAVAVVAAPAVVAPAAATESGDGAPCPARRW